tara:strand:- start:2091 stop:2603 length:513 start_codon:yes stop_codon:yes gene_type:complete
MKSINITPNLVTSIISIIFGIFIFLKIPTEVEKPLLLFGQSSSEIDPKIVPAIISFMFFIFGLYTLFFEREDKSINVWPSFSKEMLLNVLVTIIFLFGYSLTFESLGFVVSSFLLIFFLSNYMGNVNLKFVTLIAFIFPVTVFFIFVNIMHVFLPAFPFLEMRIGNFLIM